MLRRSDRDVRVIAARKIAILVAALHLGCSASRVRNVDADASRLMFAGNVPGLGLAIIHDGAIVSSRAYGFADLEAKTPLRTDTIVYGASLTKAAFAYLVMQLVDEG